MADEFNTDEEEDEEEKKPAGGEDFGALTGDSSDSESGLGNLPPLSDFDSVNQASDGNLPPLDDFGEFFDNFVGFALL